MDVMFAALLVGGAVSIAICGGLYCLSQDIQRAMKEATDKIVDAMRDRQTGRIIDAEFTVYSDPPDERDGPGPHYDANGFYVDPKQFYGDPDNNS